jgi:hypothetical protein
MNSLMDGFIPPFMKVGMTDQVGTGWSSRTLAALHDRTNLDSLKLEPNETIRSVHPPRLSRFNLYSDDAFPSDRLTGPRIDGA